MKTYRESLFDKSQSEMLSGVKCTSDSKLSNSIDKLSYFSGELNKMFSKFGLNTCKRKIHFIAQMYLETESFRSTCEGIGVCSGYAGGCDFRGRGMKQITHDYNYLAYYDYVSGTSFFKLYLSTRSGYDSVEKTIGRHPKLDKIFYENLKEFTKNLSTNLYYAMDSAGWFSTINTPASLTAMDKGIEDANVKEVTKIINGGENDLSSRQNYVRWLREDFKYDIICSSK